MLAAILIAGLILFMLDAHIHQVIRGLVVILIITVPSHHQLVIGSVGDGNGWLKYHQIFCFTLVARVTGFRCGTVDFNDLAGNEFAVFIDELPYHHVATGANKIDATKEGYW